MRRIFLHQAIKVPRAFLLSALSGLAFVSVPQSAFAQNGGVTPAVGLMQIFLALGVIIALMLVLAWLYKRVGPVSNGNKIPVKVVGGVNIGNRERIMVIEVGDQCLVLGVTAQQINTLATMPKTELSNDVQAEGPINNAFADWLKKTLEKREAKT